MVPAAPIPAVPRGERQHARGVSAAEPGGQVPAGVPAGPGHDETPQHTRTDRRSAYQQEPAAAGLEVHEVPQGEDPAKEGAGGGTASSPARRGAGVPRVQVLRGPQGPAPHRRSNPPSRPRPLQGPRPHCFMKTLALTLTAS